MSALTTTRRRILIGLAVPAMLLSALALAAGRAAAFTGYGSPTYFGATGSGDGQFSEPAGVAVNDTTNDVYLYDSGNRRVEWFNASGGKLEGQFDGSAAPTGRFAPPASISEHAAHGTLFNLAVDNDPSSPSTGDVYVVDPGNNVIDKFTATGEYLSQLTGFHAPIFGVAVDGEGHLWVAEEGSEEGGNHGPVREFDGGVKNTSLGELNPVYLRSPGIAVDSEQNLYLLKGEPNIAKLDKSGDVLAEQITVCGCVTSLAVNPGNDDLFADQGNLIARYGPFGEPYQSALETLEGISSSRGIAVNGATNTVYASQGEGDSVAVFKFAVFPDVTTGATAEIKRTTVKLEGEVNPAGQEVTSCEFEYGTSEAYGHAVPCAKGPGAGTSPVPVSAEVTGLTPQTTYYYRLVAGNANGPHAGAVQQLTTSPAVEGALTEVAVAVAATTASLHGSLEPNGLDTHYLFEYRSLTGPASDTPPQDAGSVSEDEHVNAEVSGLKPNAIYLYRIVAENSFGRTDAGYQVLKTKVLAPAVPGNPTATFIATQSADLNAALNPENTTTHYHFEYGPCLTLAGCAAKQSTPEQTSQAYGQIGASVEIAGLAPATTYSYRLVATNEFEEAGEPRQETTTGKEAMFSTSPAPQVTAATLPAGAITSTSATLAGTVDSDGQSAAYTFELGVYAGDATQYGDVFSTSAGAGTSPVTETLPVSGLQPGTTYAYRISIRSGYGEATGELMTFTTDGLPAILVTPAPPVMLVTPDIAFPGSGAPSGKHATKKTRKNKHATKTKRKTKRKREVSGRSRHKAKATRAVSRLELRLRSR